MTTLIERAKEALEDDNHVRLATMGTPLARALIAAEELAEAIEVEAVAATLLLNDPKNGKRVLERSAKRAALGDDLTAYRKATRGQS
jgi:hypothetical protein